MVRKHTKIARAVSITLVVTGSLFLFTALFPSFANADSNTTFQVNVVETLTVSVTTPDTWASSTPSSDGTFLTNKISLSVTANNTAGFTASMYATSTDLTNTSKSTATIPTLGTSSNGNTGCSSYSSSVARTVFPNNCWGYSLDDNAYSGMTDSSSTPIQVLSSNTAVSSASTQDIYFGAKANHDTASGTYVDTIIISVVTGTVTEPTDNPNDNPITPTDPVLPTDDPTNDNGAPTYTGPGTTGVGGSGSNGTTVYTTTSTDSSTTPNTTTTTTEISAGNVVNSYAGPQGVTNVQEGTPLATGLAVTSAVAATTGIIFFIIAKRRDDDDEEEEEGDEY